MKYSILALGCEEDCNALISRLDDTLKTYGNELEVQYTKQTSLQDIITQSRCAHAILMPVNDILLPPVQRKIAKEICNVNNLFATRTHYINNDKNIDFCIVEDSIGGMFAGENGYRNNPTFGREAYCVHSYSELEIERVARCAYELAEKSHKKITLADLDPHLATSQLWYKILTDINEDYPSISAGCSQMRFIIDDIAKAPSDLEIVLCDSILGKTLNAVANATLDVDAYACSLGDTPLALYTYPKNITQTALDSLAKEILSTSLGGFATDLSF